MDLKQPIDASLVSRVFGTLSDGRIVEAWTLRGSGGLELEVLTYGGIVSRLLVPDRDQNLADVVLGFGELEGYLGEHPYFGVTAGRVAGRISGGRFMLDGTTYTLPINDPPNHLHGGSVSVDKQLWQAEGITRADGSPSLRLKYHSPDGANGYPGEVDLAVTYTVTPANEFVFETEVCSSRATPVSLTHHSYFNLCGEGEGNILDHHLRIDSNTIFPTDEKMTLLDELQSVDGQAADFREAKRVGDAIDSVWQKHGDLYWLGETDQCRAVAQLRDFASGRVLDVSTSNTCLQMYGAFALDGSLTGKSGRAYPAFGGLCLECQGYPNAIGPTTAKGFGDIVVHPGSPIRNTTIYAFSTEP
jgi:aldose 1-epimerase